MSNTRASKTFGVSRSFVKRYAATAREGEPFTAKQHPGSKPEILAAEAPENRPTYVLDRIDRLIPKRLWDEFGWSETDG